LTLYKVVFLCHNYILPYILYLPTATTPETTTETAITPTAGPAPTECKPGWSHWYNTPRTSTGDYESLDDLEAEGKLLCGRHEITNIECKFYRNITR
jgi:hypothetical protein